MLTEIQMYLLLAFFGITACTKTETEIPVELRDNEQVVEYLRSLNESVTKFNKYTVDPAEVTEGKDIHTSDSLSKMQMVKPAKTGAQFMIVLKKLKS